MQNEILAPAGNLEKLKMAIEYGADAVYFAGQSMGLRAASKNFDYNDLKEGINYCHKKGKKAYITVNIIPHNEDLVGFTEYIRYLNEIGADALIASDPGTIEIIKSTIPNMEIHLSTQANTTNSYSANFWYKQGVKRIVLARELSLKEIEEIIKASPKDLEFEAFIHGAMCISYSGRCLLSSFMTGRYSNKGQCAHPCRWKYNVVEEQRPGEYFPVMEDETGTFIFNSKDLCMIEHIDKLLEIGVKSFKIEGRMKSSYYTATAVRAYKNALKEIQEKKSNRNTTYWKEELEKASHRDFTYGFYFGNPKETGQLYTSSSYIRTYDFVGLIKEYDEKNHIAIIEQRNKFSNGDILEVFGPDDFHFEIKVEGLMNEKGEPIESAPHAQQIVKFKINENIKPWFILRKKREVNI